MDLGRAQWQVSQGLLAMREFNRAGHPSLIQTPKKRSCWKHNKRHLQQSNICPFAHDSLQAVIGNDAHNCGVLNTGLTEEEICEIASDYGYL